MSNLSKNSSNNLDIGSKQVAALQECGDIMKGIAMGDLQKVATYGGVLAMGAAQAGAQKGIKVKHALLGSIGGAYGLHQFLNKDNRDVITTPE